MKILILGLNFAPEPIGVGKYTGDLAGWLSERGHQVDVIAAPPYYPEWRLRPPLPGSRGSGWVGNWGWRRERVGRVEVLRCPLWVPRRPSAARRILHLGSFALSSLLPCLWRALRRRPDVILAIEPTVMAAPTAWLAARLTGALACLHVQDLEIDAASRLDLLPKGDLYRRARSVYGRLLRRFDLVSTISRRMRRRLLELGVPAARLCRLPNWVDTRAIRPLDRPSRLRPELGLGDHELVVLYSGSMGTKQGLSGLVEVADRLAALPDLRLLICGAGPGRPSLEQKLAGRANVCWLPLQPTERLNELLNLADLHLLPQRPGVGDCVLPSKLSGMLASGRPVVAQADGGEVGAIARSCGAVVPPGDGAAMAAAIRALAADGDRRREAGRRARRMAERHLDRSLVLARYERRLLEGLARHQAAAAVARPGWWPRLAAIAASTRLTALDRPAAPSQLTVRRP